MFIHPKNSFTKFAISAFFVFIFAVGLFAQTSPKPAENKQTSPKITQVNETTVKELFAVPKENAKPLLVNFWATWCVPCREEFPDLVKIDEEFRGKIDFITITLDDPAEMTRDVPAFLTEMKAKMPTYLLYTFKENEVIGAISKDWSGGLPYTVLFNEKREVVFTKQGKIKPEELSTKIKMLVQKSEAFSQGQTDALLDKLNGVLIYKTERVKPRGYKKIYKENDKIIVIEDAGIPLTFTSDMRPTTKTFTEDNKNSEYIRGYNSISEPVIIRKIGRENLKKIVDDFKINYPADIVELKLTIN